MNEFQNDLGVITAVFEHLDMEAIPRALAVKSEIDAGSTLNELDLLFFEECLEEMANLLHVIDHYPDYQLVAGKMVALCHDITRKALENQLDGQISLKVEKLNHKLSNWWRD